MYVCIAVVSLLQELAVERRRKHQETVEKRRKEQEQKKREQLSAAASSVDEGLGSESSSSLRIGAALYLSDILVQYPVLKIFALIDGLACRAIDWIALALKASRDHYILHS